MMQMAWVLLWGVCVGVEMSSLKQPNLLLLQFLKLILCLFKVYGSVLLDEKQALKGHGMPQENTKGTSPAAVAPSWRHTTTHCCIAAPSQPVVGFYENIQIALLGRPCLSLRLALSQQSSKLLLADKVFI